MGWCDERVIGGASGLDRAVNEVSLLVRPRYRGLVGHPSSFRNHPASEKNERPKIPFHRP